MALRGLPQAAERTTVASVCSVEDVVLLACERAERFNQERLYLHKPNTAQTSRLSTRMHLGEHTADQHTSSAGSALSSSTMNSGSPKYLISSLSPHLTFHWFSSHADADAYHDGGRRCGHPASRLTSTLWFPGPSCGRSARNQRFELDTSNRRPVATA